MITQVLSLYDKKALVFKSPFFVLRTELATRALSQAVNDEKSGADVTLFPEDFALYHLGTFNDETAQFTFNKQPVAVAEAVSLKKVV